MLFTFTLPFLSIFVSFSRQMFLNMFPPSSLHSIFLRSPRPSPIPQPAPELEDDNMLLGPANEAIQQQQSEISRLEQEIERLNDYIRELQEGGSGGASEVCSFLFLHSYFLHSPLLPCFDISLTSF